MTLAEYLSIDAVHWSTLKELRRSPLHYRHRTQTPREDVDTLRLGRAAHCAVFEPDQFQTRYVTFPGNRRAGKTWDEFQAEHAGRTILTRLQYHHALSIATAVREHPVAARYLERGRAEVPIQWRDESTGLNCKARLDWVPIANMGSVGERAGAILDLKTARNIQERPFSAAVASYGYHCQLAFYRAGFDAVVGVDGWTKTGPGWPCVLIAVETLPPHDVAVYRLSEDCLWAGAEEVQELMRRLVECRTSGLWPGRYPDELEIELPAWAYPEDEDPNSSPGVRWLMGDEEGAGV